MNIASAHRRVLTLGASFSCLQPSGSARSACTGSAYNGPSSAGFKDVAEAIQATYTHQAQASLDELCLLRAMQSDDYPAEPGEIPSDSHRHAVEPSECVGLKTYRAITG